MKTSSLLSAALGLGLLALSGRAQTTPPTAPADLILHHGKVWTVDKRQPVAEAVAVRGDRIIKVGTDAEVLALRATSTRVIDLEGRLVLPGFNDAHTHFENAVDWFFQVMVMAVNEQADLLRQLRAAAARVPSGMWITGGDWSSFAWWAAQKRGEPAPQSFKPDLAAVDAITPDHPVVLRRYDRSYFANSQALQIAGLRADTPDPAGGRYEHDPATGRLTGMLYGTAGEQMERLLPPPTRAQKLRGARGVVQELNRLGITSISDIARIEDVSQDQLYRTYVERSHTDVRIFEELRRQGALSIRVNAMLPLPAWAALAGHGIRPGSGDDFLRYGTLKDFVDGPALMFAPMTDAAGGYAGSFTFRFIDEATMQRNIVQADAAGFDLGLHVLGDRGLHHLLDWYEAAQRANGPRDRRFRLIHAWHATPEDLARAGRLHMISDITPRQLLGSDPAALERSLGPVRAKTAFAWRTMIEQGVRLSIGSDLPGLFNRTESACFAPLENLFSVVTRKYPMSATGAAWHPEQCLTIQEAIQAYTLNPAYASHEENLKGTITEGKLADLVVLSQDILSLPPDELLKTRVDCTIVGGRVVYTAK